MLHCQHFNVSFKKIVNYIYCYRHCIPGRNKRHLRYLKAFPHIETSLTFKYMRNEMLFRQPAFVCPFAFIFKSFLFKKKSLCGKELTCIIIVKVVASRCPSHRLESQHFSFSLMFRIVLWLCFSRLKETKRRKSKIQEK